MEELTDEQLKHLIKVLELYGQVAGAYIEEEEADLNKLLLNTYKDRLDGNNANPISH